MEALRKSGAAGSHRDKKKEMKTGKLKHKGKTMDESIYTNPAGAQLSKLGRILMDKAATTKDDALSSVLGRVEMNLHAMAILEEHLQLKNYQEKQESVKINLRS